MRTLDRLERHPFRSKDALLSAIAVFSYKWPSLLSFEIDMQHGEVIAGNLRRLFHIGRIPSDTTLREIVDEISPEALHEVFTRVFAALQRGKDLEAYVFIDGYYLAAPDGTGVFSSGCIHCPSCCEKNHRNGKKIYFHQAVATVLIHPGQKVVILFSPEPITRQDGNNKNDCE